jgi:hypothetical protein
MLILILLSHINFVFLVAIIEDNSVCISYFPFLGSVFIMLKFQ